MKRRAARGRIGASDPKSISGSSVRAAALFAAAIEPLEQRALMSVIPVTSVADSGPGSLRDALTQAQPGDTVDATALTGTIALASPLTISSDVTIDGPGAGSLAINGGGATQLFAISAGTNVTIGNFTLTAGSATDGGAITTAGNLTLIDDAITNNTATDVGGAIDQEGGTLTLLASTLSGNAVSSTGPGHPDADGGAIYIGSGDASLTNCTLAGNTAGSGGPGDKAGGAIFVANGSSLSLMNDTIAANNVNGGGGPAARNLGGGVDVDTGAALTIQNTILADNSATTSADLELDGTVTDNGNNLLGSAVAGFTSGVNGDIVGVDPQLSALADNGGPTQTMAIAASSPARDAGSTANGAPTTDQRGFSRSGPPDIGAYEYQDTAPTFASLPVTSAQAGQAYSYTISTTDADGDAMTISAITLPAWLTLTVSGNGTATLTGTPAVGDVGNASVDLSVSDGVLSSSQGFTISVAAAPVLPPTLTSISTFISGTENTPYTITYAALLTQSNASDPNGLPISFLITSVDSGSMTIDGSPVVAGSSTLSSGGSIVWTPASGAIGTLDAFSVEATDGTATSTPSVAVQIQVAAAYQAPVAVNDSFNTTTGTAVSGNVLTNDSAPSGGTLTAILQSQPSHGSVLLAPNGNFLYTPAAGFAGIDSFTYVANDGTANSNVATVSIDVAAVIQPGEFDFSTGSETALSTAGSVTLTVDRNTNTSGAATVDYAVTGGTAVAGTDYELAVGTMQFADGQATALISVEILSGAAASGDVTLVLTLSNPTGGTTIGATASNTLTIQHVTPEVPPVAVNDSYSTVEGTTLTGNVLTNDSSPMGKTFTAVLQSNVSHGTLSLSGNGNFTYTPAAGFVGSDSFTYADNDGTATGNTATVAITVTSPVTPIAKAGEFDFDQSSQSVTNLAGSLVVTVDRTGGSSGAVTVDYAASGGTAVNGTDYTLASGTLSFADGQTSGTFSISIAPIGAGEADKTIVLSLGNPTGGASLGSGTSDTITITHVADTPPTVNNVAITRKPGNAVVINLLSKVKASAGANLTVSLLTSPAYGSVSLLPNGVPGTYNVLYAPTPSFSVNDSFQFQVSDGKGGVTTATVNITVYGAGLDVDPLNTKENDLVVVGSPRNDKILFFNNSKGTGVIEDGKLQGFFDVTGRLVAYGLAGNDDIVDAGVGHSCYFWGGDGNDTLIGSDGNDVLIGGNGNDDIIGGSGRNILIGGAGSDVLRGGPLEDILIAGPTSFDVDDPATRAQINDLRNELLLSVPSAPVRWATIMSSAGVGTSHAAFNTSTILDDDSADVLIGGGSMNWYIGGFGDAGKHKDRVIGFNATNDLETNL